MSATVAEPTSSAAPILTGPRFLTIDQVCELLCVSKSTVYALTDSGRLPCYPLGLNGGAIRISIDDLNAYLQAVRQGGAAATRAPAIKPVKLERLTPRVRTKREKKTTD